MATDHTRVAIIGGGPAGWTAAIYTARAGLNPVVFDGLNQASQITVASKVENFPGFPEGISGGDLVMNMHDQAEHFGARTEVGDVAAVDLSVRPFHIVYGFMKDQTMTADSIIFATGAEALRLHCPGADRLWKRSISACAVCDSHMAKDKITCVIGGGDVAIDEALYLTRFAKKVYLIHRRDQLRGSTVMQKRIFESDVEILWNTTVEEMKGETQLEFLVLKNTETGELRELPMETVFYGIGHSPNVALVKGQVELTPSHHILLPGKGMMTSVPGVFAAGDVTDSRYRQAICAAGQGAAAAIDCEHWLTENTEAPVEGTGKMPEE